MLTEDQARSTPPASLLPLPDTCPGCGGAWSSSEECSRCGISRAEVLSLLGAACASFREAKAHATQGRFALARTSLQAAIGLGLPPTHPVVCRLGELLDHLEGYIPISDGEANVAYSEVRGLVAKGEWEAAREAAARASRVAPEALAAQKLYVLCLAGAGREKDATRVCRELLAHFPAEPDLLRYAANLPEEPAQVRQRRNGVLRAAKPRRRAGTAALPVIAARVYAPPVWLVITSVAGCSLGILALALAAVTALRSETSSAVVVTTPTPVDPVPVASSTAAPVTTAPPPQAKPPMIEEEAWTELPAALARIYTEDKQTFDEGRARQWLNEALRARRAGRLVEAERLARAAYVVGKETYVGEEALLLCAQAADNRDNPRAAVVYYARLADEYPGSAYAPLALLSAARAAQRQGREQDAEAYAHRLVTKYPRAPEARRWTGRRGAREEGVFNDR